MCFPAVSVGQFCGSNSLEKKKKKKEKKIEKWETFKPSITVHAGWIEGVTSICGVVRIYWGDGWVDTPCADRGAVFSHVLAIGRAKQRAPGRFTSKHPCLQNSLNHLGAEAGGSVPRHLPQLQQDCPGECGWENCTKTPLPFTSIPLLDFPLQANACQQPVGWRKTSEHEDLWCCAVPAGL